MSLMSAGFFEPRFGGVCISIGPRMSATRPIHVSNAK